MNNKQKKAACLDLMRKGSLNWSKEIKKRLDKLGFTYPKNEKQLDEWEEAFKDLKVKADPNMAKLIIEQDNKQNEKH